LIRCLHTWSHCLGLGLLDPSLDYITESDHFGIFSTKCLMDFTFYIIIKSLISTPHVFILCNVCVLGMLSIKATYLLNKKASTSRQLSDLTFICSPFQYQPHTDISYRVSMQCTVHTILTCTFKHVHAHHL